MAVAFDYNVWIAGNTALCHRLSARITETTCEKNRHASSGEKADLRCQGCGGLHNQSGRGPAQLRLAAFPASAEEAAELDPITVALMSILDDEEEVAEAKPATTEEELDWFDEVDLDDETLLKLFPELAEECAEIEAAERRYVARANTEPKRRYAVFLGRCRRCGGYMAHDIEGQFGERDDDIHRCYTCGWRTSPVYEWNRG